MSGDDQHKHLNQDCETMKRKYQELLSDSETMRAKVICLESEKEEALRQLKRSKEIILSHRKELTGLQEHLHFKKEMETQIENYKKQILELQSDLDRLRDLLKDTENDMRKYQNQYQDSMDLVEKLTSNNVDLKIKVSSFSSELDSLRIAHSSLQECYENILADKKSTEKEFKELRRTSTEEKDSRDFDIKRLHILLAERDEEIIRIRKEAEDSHNEKRLLCRTYNSTLKDLKRQLHATAKASVGIENGKSENDSTEQLSIKSRTSSCTSLELSPVNTQIFNGNGLTMSSTNEDNMNSHNLDIDKSVLVDKIVRLQRELARKDEKCDFLEDHIALLTLELKKRSK